jgi:hypothetical protein
VAIAKVTVSAGPNLDPEISFEPRRRPQRFPRPKPLDLGANAPHLRAAAMNTWRDALAAARDWSRLYPIALISRQHDGGPSRSQSMARRGCYPTYQSECVRLPTFIHTISRHVAFDKAGRRLG